MKKFMLALLCILTFILMAAMTASCGNSEQAGGPADTGSAAGNDGAGAAPQAEGESGAEGDPGAAGNTEGDPGAAGNTEDGSQALSLEQVKAVYQDLEKKGYAIEGEYIGYMDPTDDTVVIDGNKYFCHSKYKSIADLKAATEAAYTKAYAEQAFYGFFSAEPPHYIDLNGKLYRLNWGGWGGRGPTDISSISITGQTSDTITFTAITEPEVSGAFKHLNDFRLKKVDGSWRLDCSIQGEGGVELAVYATVIPEDGLHLRSGPSTSSESLCILAQGSVVEVYDTTSYPDWAHVGYVGADGAARTGYAAIEYLSF